jgi:putative PIN family toxin of toxin-antitoxin system
MKVFPDTNVLISAAATRGLCADVLREVLVSHELCLAEVLIVELASNLRDKLGVPEALIAEYIEILRADSLMAESAAILDLDIRDQGDVRILSAAAASGAEVFVTGDKELLALRKVQNMSILSPRRFWERVKIKSDRG